MTTGTEGRHNVLGHPYMIAGILFVPDSLSWFLNAVRNVQMNNLQMSCFLTAPFYLQTAQTEHKLHTKKIPMLR